MAIDKCAKCGTTKSKTFWDFEDGSTLCDVCEKKYGAEWQRVKEDERRRNAKTLNIPVWITAKIYIALSLSVLCFIGLYVLLYFIWGWILVGIGLIPLILVLFIKRADMGMPITKKDHPRLFLLVQSVAWELNQPMPDKVVLTLGPEIYVSGFFEKKLSIGIASLRSLSEGEFKAIISHEFGHFYGKDTIIGSVFWKIDNALEKSTKFGGAWWSVVPILQFALIGAAIMAFFYVYRVFFSIINFFYSRQLEYRADFIASEVAGKSNFHDGLRNYVLFTTYFDSTAYNSIAKLLDQKKAFVNVYETAYTAYNEQNIKKLEKEVIGNQKFHIFSTHPRIEKRLRLIQPTDKKTLKDPAIHLFNNFSKLEEDMSTHLTRLINNNLYMQREFILAQQREGRCRYCQEQFNKLDELLNHEAGCAKNPKVQHAEKIAPPQNHHL